MGARVLSTGNFYGSSMPRPFLLPSVQWVGKNLKLVTFENQNSRVNRPQSPTSILLEWAEEAPWKQGGLSASTKTEYKQSLKRTIRKQQKAAKKKKISKKKTVRKTKATKSVKKTIIIQKQMQTTRSVKAPSKSGKGSLVKSLVSNIKTIRRKTRRSTRTPPTTPQSVTVSVVPTTPPPAPQKRKSKKQKRQTPRRSVRSLRSM